MNLSIILVNYNTTEHLLECLKSLFINIGNISYETIVIDNNSSDREIEKCMAKFPEVNLILRTENDGFGGGCNYGASFAKGKYLLFVNPDIIFESDIFSDMLLFMESNLDCGACSPVFTNFKGELIYTYNKFLNIKWEFFEFLGTGNEREVKILLSNDKILNKSDSALMVDWLTGACLMVRADLFKYLKGFDNEYFLYYEDTDLQYRIHKYGYSVACLTKLRVKHFVNSSVKSENGENIYYYHFNRSKLIYMYKHFGFFKRNFIRSLMLLGIFLRMAALYVRSRYKYKRTQKMLQYKKMLRIYFSNYRQLLIL